MFDRRKYNYSFVVEVDNGQDSETYTLTAQSGSEAVEDAMEMFMDEFNVGCGGLTGRIISYERIS